MKVLVTGSRGFIGRRVVAALRGQHEIIEISRSLGQDLSDYRSLESCEADAVVHLAALVSSATSDVPARELYRFNLDAALNVARFCSEKKVQKLINLNTYVYGPPDYLPVDENHPVRPASHYGKSKHLAEQLLFYYLTPETRVISLRAFNIYGPGQSPDFLIPVILGQALAGGEIELRETRSRRDFLFVEDLVDLILKVLESSIPAGIYNAGSGELTAIGEIVDTVSSLLGRPLQVNARETQAHTVAACSASIERIVNALGWHPRTTLREGLQKTLEFMNASGKAPNE